MEAVMGDITRVALDAMGGDNAPHSIVQGAIDAVNERDDIKMVDLATACDFEDSSPLTGLFHWNYNGKLSDPDNYYQKSPKEILSDLFSE